MFDTFSKDIIYLRLAAPYRQTLFVELIQFQPGSDGVAAGGSVSASMPRPQIANHQPILGRQHPSNSHSFSHHNPHPSTSSVSYASSSMSTFSASPTAHPSAPPPPPWSRWGTMSTPAMPPSTQRRGNGESSRSNGTPQPSASTSKKRKHVEEIPLHHQHLTDDEPRSSFPLKRHAGPAPTPTPMSPPRPVQTLSPSLAMIVSPTNQAVHTSPRSNQLPPMRNGSSGSPVLPPVKSLIGGESRPS